MFSVLFYSDEARVPFTWLAQRQLMSSSSIKGTLALDELILITQWDRLVSSPGFRCTKPDLREARGKTLHRSRSCCRI